MTLLLVKQYEIFENSSKFDDKVKVHYGFQHAYSSFGTQIIDTILEILSQPDWKLKSVQVIFIGHSLGGSLASLSTNGIN